VGEASSGREPGDLGYRTKTSEHVTRSDVDQPAATALVAPPRRRHRH
jgi:hypothetical protein